MADQSQAISIFVDKLVEEKNFGNLDPEVLEQIKIDLLGRIEDRINATILANIPAEKLEQFDVLLNSGNTEEIQSFCQNNIKNFDEVIAEALISFRNIYLNA